MNGRVYNRHTCGTTDKNISILGQKSSMKNIFIGKDTVYLIQSGEVMSMGRINK